MKSSITRDWALRTAKESGIADDIELSASRPSGRALQTSPAIVGIAAKLGPPCEHQGCTGVLVQHLTLASPQECFHRCSICEREFHRMPVTDMLGFAERTFNRVLKGERTS
jgi:hypothetical protein